MQNLQVERSAAAPQRFDAGLVRQVLTRASEIENAKQETLTADQIETLGREVGLSPEAVRRALGELQPTTVTTSARAHTTTPLIRQSEVRGMLASGTVLGLVIGGALYFLLQTTRMTGVVSPSPAMSVIVPLVLAFLIYALSPLLAFRYGWHKANPRLGMIAGAWGGIWAAISAYCGIMLAVSTYPTIGYGFTLPVLYPAVRMPGTLFLMIAAALALGVLGAKMRVWWDGLRRAEER